VKVEDDGYKDERSLYCTPQRLCRSVSIGVTAQWP